MMNRDTIAVWVDGYVQAWQTNDPATIGQLFAEDAAYFSLCPTTPPNKSAASVPRVAKPRKMLS